MNASGKNRQVSQNQILPGLNRLTLILPSVTRKVINLRHQYRARSVLSGFILLADQL